VRMIQSSYARSNALPERAETVSSDAATKTRLHASCIASGGRGLPRSPAIGSPHWGVACSMARGAVLLGSGLRPIVRSLLQPSMEELAMGNHCPGSLPEEPEPQELRLQRIIDFWNPLRVSGDTGATTWDVLGPLERQVTEYLDSASPDIQRAESLTAQAGLLIEGCCDS
jgi:hypothetical protein